MKEEKEKQQEEEIISLTKYFIEIDLTEKLFHILVTPVFKQIFTQ